MVIIFDGAPVAAQVPDSPRPPRYASRLPTIPTHGPAALLSPDVLVSRVEEISWAGNGPQGQRRRQQRLPLSTTSLRHLRRPSSLHQHRSIVHKLHKTDHAHAPRFLDSLLVRCNNESSASLPVDKDGELALSQKLDDELISNATFETSLKEAGLDDSYQAPPSRVTTPSRVPVASEHSVRIRYLRDSFKNSFKDISDRLEEIEKHSHVCTAVSTSAPSSQHAEKIMHELFYQPRSPALYRSEKDGDLSEELHTALPQILRAFESSAVSYIPPKQVKNSRSFGKEDLGLIATSASMEEVALATDLLNFLRWLCGLAPVTLNENCVRTCQAVTQALLPRAALFLKPSSAQFNSIIRFATLLAEFVGLQCRSIILHGEASLFEAVLQCLLTCRSPVDTARPMSTLSPRLGCIDDLIYDARRRAEQFQKSISTEIKKPSQPAIFIPQAAREIIDLRTLPCALEDFRIFWLLAEKNLPDLQASPRVVKGRKSQVQQAKDQHRTRKSPRQPQRTRAIAWSQEQEERQQAKTAVFWGDRDEKILFRRYLLNPALESFGASRANDTCAMWTAAESVPQGGGGGKSKMFKRNLGTRSPRPEEYPTTSRDIICFPPPGFFPHEFLLGMVPTWTIMPNGQIYQPTKSLSVRMWRVRIDDSGAERLTEISMSSFFCDCSAKGNPFCIFFEPELQKIEDGDQFEVELSGLTGCETKLHIFHHFRTFFAEHLDSELFTVAGELCSMLESNYLWKEPERVILGSELDSPSGGRRTSMLNSRMSLHASTAYQSKGSRKSVEVPQSPVSIRPESPLMLPDIGLISHPSLSFTTEAVDLSISLFSAEAKVLRSVLHLVRASGNEEVRRATWVLKCGQNFIVKVKLPMSHCRYELSFKVSLAAAPEIMLEHPLKYIITASETCQNLLISMDHPLREKFGYAFQSHLVQAHSISVISPVLYHVRSGYVYFLVYIGPEAYTQHELLNANARCHTSLFTSRLAPDESNKAPTAHQEKLARAGGTSNAEPATCVVTTFQSILKPALEPVVQDARQAIHIDISVLQKNSTGLSLGQRYVKRLQRRSDFPELYNGLLWFSESEADCIVEMFLRFPSAQAAQYAPLKIGEWRIVRKEEEFPIGFSNTQ